MAETMLCRAGEKLGEIFGREIVKRLRGIEHSFGERNLGEHFSTAREAICIGTSSII